MENDHERFLATRLPSKAVIETSLPPKYRLSRENMAAGEARLLDTFDESLWRSGRILLVSAGTLWLFNRRKSGFIRQTVKSVPTFIDELSPGTIQAQLNGISPLRAFKPVMCHRISIYQYRLLDDQGKTRARLNVLEFRCSQGSLVYAETQSLRGYEKDRRLLSRALEELETVRPGDISDLLLQCGYKVRGYTSKPKIELRRSHSSLEAANLLITGYLRVARVNEEGIVDDIDTEFLHDYRVSLRKIRSILSSFKAVYSDSDTIRLKEEFSALMKRTNELRDLDVHLLDRDRYMKMIPDSLHAGLKPMFAEYTRRRTHELRRLIEFLRSHTYQTSIMNLASYFENQGVSDPGSRADTNAFRYIGAFIWKRYKKVRRIASKIDEMTPDSDLHRLRINCKKLRYMMEISDSLFVNRRFNRLTKLLKRLQDCLGRFNDYSLQQKSLQMFLSSRATKKGKDDPTVAQAIGALQAVLHQQQVGERSQILVELAEFDRPSVRRSFRSLFH